MPFRMCHGYFSQIKFFMYAACCKSWRCNVHECVVVRMFGLILGFGLRPVHRRSIGHRRRSGWPWTLRWSAHGMGTLGNEKQQQKQIGVFFLGDMKSLCEYDIRQPRFPRPVLRPLAILLFNLNSIYWCWVIIDPLLVRVVSIGSNYLEKRNCLNSFPMKSCPDICNDFWDRSSVPNRQFIPHSVPTFLFWKSCPGKSAASLTFWHCVVYLLHLLV